MKKHVLRNKFVVAFVFALCPFFASACLPKPIPPVFPPNPPTPTPPGAPTNVVALANGPSVDVSWSASTAANDTPVTSYTVTANPGSMTITTADLHANFRPLNVGVLYSFTAVATNSVGQSDSSTVSNQTTVAPRNRLDPGEKLLSSETLISTSGQYVFSMQLDGNLVLGAGGMVVWQTNTGGHPGAWLSMKTDGNLVAYEANGTPLWTPYTAGVGNFFHLQNDGNLVVYHDNIAQWQSSSYNANAYLYPENTLQSGWGIHSANHCYGFYMQTDGNVALFNECTSPWTTMYNSGSNGHSGSHMTMKTDGNLVAFDSNGTPIWTPFTAGAGNHLVVRNDGDVAVYSPDGTIQWHTDTVKVIGGGRPPAGAQNMGYNPYNTAGLHCQCTFYAEQRMANQTGMYMPQSGHAYTFASRASAGGWTAGGSPAVNSVAVFPQYTLGSGDTGHVGWVVEVSGNRIRIQDYNGLVNNCVENDWWLTPPAGTQYIYSDR